MIRFNKLVFVFPVIGMILVGCGFNNPQSSPDVVYSKVSTTARQLQVPPDLTNISNGEQFILPGTESGSLSRNRLLPTFTSAKYVRNGDQNWLELEQSAEAIWPQLLDFVRQQKLTVEKTEPTTGLIFTQWRTDDEKSGGLLKNLISNDEMLSRFAFRLERNGVGTRVFARSMRLEADVVKSLGNNEWPATSHNPEQVAQLLTRLLVFFGAEEQKAKGILSEPQARAVLDDAELQTTASGSQLVVHKGFTPSFNDVKTAIEKLAYTIVESDGNVGQLTISNAETAQPILVSLTPVHVSAVRVLVSQAGGQRLPKAQELTILTALHEQII